MIQLSRQSYQRNFIFPLLSYTNLFRLATYLIAIISPFFIVYATNSFYQTSYVVIQQPSFSFTSQYSVKIITSIASYQYGNFYLSSNDFTQSLSFSLNGKQQEVAQFNFQWPHAYTQKVKEVQIVLGVNYIIGKNNAQGFIYCSLNGYDLGDATVSGRLQIKKGTQYLPYQSSTILKQNLFSFTEANKVLQKQQTFLKYQYTALPVSYPNNQLLVRMKMNKKSVFALDSTPSVLGQFIWSWIQYCPIMIVFVWFVNQMLSIMMKQSIFKTTIQQDKQYMAQVMKIKQRGKPKQKINHY